MRPHLLLFSPLVLLLIACPDSPEDPNPSGSGELGVGNFAYLCRSAGDFTCSIGQTQAAFPKAFAATGRFGLDYTWKSDVDHINEPLPTLQSAAPGHLQRADQTFTALLPGYAAVLAVTGNSEVVDLIHASIRPIDALRLVDPLTLPGVAPLTDILLPLESNYLVQLVPLDLNDVPLSGAIDVTWTLETDAVVALTSGQGTARIQLDALAAGETTLTATVGDKPVTISVTVDPTLEQPTTGDNSTTDVGTTGTTDADTTTGTSTGTTSETTTTTTDTTGGAL